MAMLLEVWLRCVSWWGQISKCGAFFVLVWCVFVAVLLSVPFLCMQVADSIRLWWQSGQQRADYYYDHRYDRGQLQWEARVL